EISQPQFKLSINRDRAGDLNLTAGHIEKYLEYAYSDGKISTINTDINQYDVIVETLPKYYKDPSVLDSLYIRSKTNQLVPLSQVVEQSESVGPLSVNHIDGLPSSMITFNLNQMPLSEAIQHIEKIAKEVLPPTVYGTIQGTADVFKKSFSDLAFLFLVTLFIIYIILGILYENLVHPLTILSALPPTTFAGLLTLYVFGYTLSLYSFIGLIMLIGIVMKNGIILIDFANTNLSQGKNARDAIFEACTIRFRPILMTTFSAFAGAIPIAIGIGGASAQARRSLGVVIVGGLIFSQILNLYLTPVIYIYFENFYEWIKRKFSKGEDETSQTPTTDNS
ncbi:MAG TPA: efflux RND transporter permease subunit, partial [Chlamydiales bacterium]|nr:efflux RND transporter permease subunit [Chlamydiales bacterium]